MLRAMTGTIVDAYALHLTAAGARPRTVAARRQQVGAMLAEVGDPLAATAEDLTRWLAAPDWKPNTRAAMRAAARGFFAWMKATGRRDDNPADALPPVHVPPPSPHPAPDAALAAAHLAAAGPREDLMVDLAARAGLRRAEIAGLRFADLLDDDGGPVLRVTGKGGRTRTVPIADDLAAAVRRQVSPYVFPGKSAADHMTPENVGRVLSRLLGDDYTAHTLRHRFATRAYRGSGGDILAVQQLLGHSSPATTQVYVAVDPDHLRRAAVAAG